MNRYVKHPVFRQQHLIHAPLHHSCLFVRTLIRLQPTVLTVLPSNITLNLHISSCASPLTLHNTKASTSSITINPRHLLSDRSSFYLPPSLTTILTVHSHPHSAFVFILFQISLQHPLVLFPMTLSAPFFTCVSDACTTRRCTNRKGP